ncbi:rhodanese-like domain-containing protein [uncultured Winogradskyella sp.]|uniref:rhodanese-like domain-containing protein n=1 Tax=uncultured Winogradskyella sp. TaxID=395353 RepID=UPI00262F49B6|nr:rhodanese-like domain-containing protein [uncultured Winogradskyella sp.]
MKIKLFYLFLVVSLLGFSQKTISKLLKQHNSERIPYISVHELAMPKTKVILLDAREINEFNVSHLQNAICVGYNDFDVTTITENVPDKSSKIVVYCSLGIRSEDVAEHLKKSGYTNVFNLYGGIFEWKNNDFPVYNKHGETEEVHAFSKAWSKWLLKGNKIYD